MEEPEPWAARGEGRGSSGRTGTGRVSGESLVAVVQCTMDFRRKVRGI